MYSGFDMARKFLKRFLPSQAIIKKHPSLQFLGGLLHDPNLFHLNRHSVSVAFFVGIFVAFAFPLPGQMAVAALGAFLFRCNLPISVALVWITNPLTIPFCFYIAYVLGCFVLQIPPEKFQFELSWEWAFNELERLLPPFLVGSVFLGFILGALGYFGMQLFWRLQVAHTWEKRLRKRALKTK
jgi:uncharacterized protein (DUF2062 family)